MVDAEFASRSSQWPPHFPAVVAKTTSRGKLCLPQSRAGDWQSRRFRVLEALTEGQRFWALSAAAAGQFAEGGEGLVRRRPAADQVHHPAQRLASLVMARF